MGGNLAPSLGTGTKFRGPTFRMLFFTKNVHFNAKILMTYYFFLVIDPILSVVWLSSSFPSGLN